MTTVEKNQPRNGVFLGRPGFGAKIASVTMMVNADHSQTGFRRVLIAQFYTKMPMFSPAVSGSII
jgi:hypothetical protein